jgi:hydroxypyruvate isomerase
VTSPRRRRLSVCVEFLFADDGASGVAGAIRRAAAAGIDTVEMWGWRGRDLMEIRRALDETGVVLHTMTMDPLLPLGDRECHTAALEAFDRSVEAAARLGCSRLLVTSGDRADGHGEEDARQAIATALASYASRAEAAGMTVLLEPLNSRLDHPRCAIDRCATAIDVVDDIDSPALQIVYDFYHGHVMGDAPQDVLGGGLARLGHVQLADVPGRNEPGTGGIDWLLELGWILDSGYSGIFGLECRPSRSSAEAVGRAQHLLDHLAGVSDDRRHDYGSTKSLGGDATVELRSQPTRPAR